MTRRAAFLLIGTLVFSGSIAQAQSPQQLIQQIVDSERAANATDHSQWLYLEEIQKPKEHLVEWVVSTTQGNVRRVLERDSQKVPEERQHDLIQKFLHDPRAQNKDVAESIHDNQQIDDLLKLLPIAFVWTQTSATTTTISLHFEPAPNFHPPTREARVFSSMRGDLIADGQQHRIHAMSGQLMHEVTFGGGLLGKLKEGSSFSLEQEQVGPSLWQISAFHVRLQGNALLFKSISLLQDDQRSGFQSVPSTITLDQAATSIMRQPDGTPRMQRASTATHSQ